MEMTLLSITVWFTQFLIVSALYFNTPPTNTPSDYTETTQITSATTKTNPEIKILIYATSSSPLTASTTQKSITNLPSEVHTQTNITPNVTPTPETASLHPLNSSTPSQNVMMDDGESVSSASNVAMSDANNSHTTVSTNFAGLTPQKDDSNETGTPSSVSYNSDGRTVQTPDTLSDPVDSVSTVPWRYSTEKEDERTKADEGNYETNSTQATFANMKEESRGTRGTEGSSTFSSEHREEHYDTAANTINVSDTTATVSNKWSTSQSTDIPMTTPSYTTAQGYPTFTDAPEYHTSTGGVNHSTTQENIYRFTNSTATTRRENRTGTDTPGGTTANINISIITDNSLNATNNRSNKNDTENKVRPSCLNPKPGNHSRPSKLVCFLTLWTLAMTATIFLGITIFLWVRLSVSKKKMKRRVKRGQTCEKESLWAEPKASVQDRVEFWYVNGSTLEADRKEKDRRRMKRRGREQDNEENSLWIQPRVTVEDITEFWYANRHMKEERTEDT
ncbi:flocculation protein FLO11-like [Sinocyclocheilus anshuiensis]|uniref:flocculation protein FLO11-like n=1 Tax=Sinocyclocheilus anshuiensis TaxID=1608454 RepID=UPI0007BA6C9A|nr:PREDICTED: flocculation protein FLO11-like [Sinocyclocheilus anshuiensis]XP_016302469.1 PREDICTED: flocculation protein FLO11-like [Sinocyclocheilus anshuiensis]